MESWKNNRETIILESDDVGQLEQFLINLEQRQPVLTVYALAMDSDVYVIQVTAITIQDFERIVNFYLSEGFTVFTTEGVFVYDEEAD